jgi:hypothetical protein
MVVIETICETGHQRIWRSQPLCGNAPLGNLLTAGTVVFSGASPSRFLTFLNLLELQ